MAGSATTYEENLALAQSAMGRYADAPLPHLIAGRRVLSRSGETFTNHSPIDGSCLVSYLCRACPNASEKAYVFTGVWLNARRFVHDRSML